MLSTIVSRRVAVAAASSIITFCNYLITWPFLCNLKFTLVHGSIQCICYMEIIE